MSVNLENLRNIYLICYNKFSGNNNKFLWYPAVIWPLNLAPICAQVLFFLQNQTKPTTVHIFWGFLIIGSLRFCAIAGGKYQQLDSKLDWIAFEASKEASYLLGLVPHIQYKFDLWNGLSLKTRDIINKGHYTICFASFLLRKKCKEISLYHCYHYFFFFKKLLKAQNLLLSFLPSGLDVDHDAGHFRTLATAGLNFVAGGMWLEIAIIVDRG